MVLCIREKCQGKWDDFRTFIKWATLEISTICTCFYLLFLINVCIVRQAQFWSRGDLLELFVSQNISLSMSCEYQCITKKHWTSPLCITMLLWKNGMKANCWGRGKRKKGFLLPKGSIGLYHIQTIKYNVASYYNSWLRSVITFTLIL